MILLLLLLPARASATWSIVAADPASGAIGAAGASCVGARSILLIYGGVPSTGALVAQAQLNIPSRDRGVELLQQGATPAQVVAGIASSGFDSDFETRQFGVVTLNGLSAGFTGSRTNPYASDRQFIADGFTVSVQGNLLTGVEVLDQASAAFLGCDLADRLMSALEAGGDRGAGDGRCTPSGIPADSAFIQVDLPSGNYLRLEVLSRNAADNPLPRLRAEFDAWRTTNPCPVIERDAGAADAVAPAEDAAAAQDATAPADSAQPRADAASTRPTTRGGCGCSTKTTPNSPTWVILIALSCLLTRRSQRE